MLMRKHEFLPFLKVLTTVKKIPFSSAQFLAATLSHQDLPVWRNAQGHLLPEIAIVGKSNVGKSSLINHLLKHRGLARISAKPGKTQTINFFMIDQEVILVDLPGYGFARVSGDLKKQWAFSIDDYLKCRSTIRLLLLLLDSRREPSAEDHQLIEWAIHRNLPLLILFTKCDKLKEDALAHHPPPNWLANAAKTPLPYIHYSIKDAKARSILIHQINDLLISH